MPFEDLPVLDVNLWRSTSASDKAEFARQLRIACHDVGFFYVRGHGVPDDVIAAAFAASKSFFDLPLERKLRIESINSPYFRGYTRLGNERTNGAQDYREQIDFGSEMPPSDVANAAEGNEHAYLHGPNQWPSESDCAGFRDALETLMSHLYRLGVDLMAAIAVSLGLAENYFEDTFERDPHIRMKVRGNIIHSTSVIFSVIFSEICVISCSFCIILAPFSFFSLSIPSHSLPLP